MSTLEAILIRLQQDPYWNDAAAEEKSKADGKRII